MKAKNFKISYFIYILLFVMIVSLLSSFIILHNLKTDNTNQNDIVSDENTSDDGTSDDTSSDDDNIVLNIDFSTFSYNAIGDSITYGRDYKTGGQLQDTYIEVVAEILGLQSTNNLGKGSSTIAVPSKDINARKPMVFRYEDISSFADIISVMGGVNDWACNIPLGTIESDNVETFYGGLKALFSGIKERYPNAWLFGITPMPVIESPINSIGIDLQDYVDAFVNVCNLYNISVLNVYELDGIIEDLTITDGVHPSQNYVSEVFAPTIAEFIKDNYNK